MVPFDVKSIRLENFGLLTYVALVPETTDSDLSLHVEGGTVVYRVYVVIGTVVYRSAEKIAYEPGKFNFRPENSRVYQRTRKNSRKGSHVRERKTPVGLSCTGKLKLS